ncbi:hypothetical protein VP1G_05039 [Cytospora mali]|uniref:Uncharacterized protein n=1 Tax=Cytospora mali TaxID=578113 RepID=A0A194V1B6_CYTMA|nr:hypothetical protein VP1G_05039 [Valsa mali var. pyri (nom. inval.)]
MAISWGTIKSLVFFFGPMLVPKAIAWYRSARAAQTAQKAPIRALPRRSAAAISLLVTAALLFAVYTLPILSPENVFTTTRSNPTTSNNLLLTRLETLRPLTPRDDTLRDKFESKASKLLYYKYGPDVLLDCPFCNSQEPSTYLVYAVPAVAAAHLANAVLLGLATSRFVTGRAGQQWRGLTTYAALGVAAADMYVLAQWDHVAGNEKARVLSEVTFLHWRMRVYRYLALAGLDLLLAGVLYVSGTNRMFLVAPSTAERVNAITEGMHKTRARLQSAGIIKNTTARDAELRAAEARYWAFEVVSSQEAMESEEVMESMRDAVENRRINLDVIGQDAETYAQNVLQHAISS